ncbi:hypothetical protein QQF64_021221 [Cirrhinus molitorella]|uniref:SUEL-type lectin domain-containing protein n=1 Tax=Cirrhinus molitorella TaxID=172907 RepID=A0ABR3LDP6_9TELE
MLRQKSSWIILLIFLCQHEVEANPTRKVACEGKQLHLHCDSGLIKVTKANYGRTDHSTCAAGKPKLQLQNKQCFQPKSFFKVSTRCDGRKECFIAAVNGVFSDPCVKTYKYLEVYYTCIKKEANPTRKVACEGKHLHLHCDSGLIKVTKANYGRTDHSTCAAGKPKLQLQNKQCFQPKSFFKVSTRCDGRKECSIAAVNGVFSDPCVKTYKYLEVYYTCIKKAAKKPIK